MTRIVYDTMIWFFDALWVGLVSTVAVHLFRVVFLRHTRLR